MSQTLPRWMELNPFPNWTYVFSHSSDKPFDVLYKGLTSGSTAIIDENSASGSLIQCPSGSAPLTRFRQASFGGVASPERLGGGVIRLGTIVCMRIFV
jgi:hypothetical protein